MSAIRRQAEARGDLYLELHRPDDILESFLEQWGDVVTAVIGQGREVHHGRDLGRGEALDQLLDELRVTEQFLVARVVVLGHVRLPCREQRRR